MTAFVVVAVVGGALCVLSVLFDGLLDALDLDLGGGFLSLTSVSAAAALFGLSGIVAVSGLGWGPGAAGALGAGVAVVTLLAAGLLVRSLRRSGPETSQTVLGARGRVTTPASAGRYGEVHLQLHGTTVKWTAVADGDLRRGDAVEVVELVSPTAVRVRPLDPG
ncbi:NfeD family protein [Kineococcus terrestris]|uniref:NfeD family protein n=1 Tax=Kineococcus terrestris TaxID=2044856 RepID=UPI0034DAF28F